MVGRFIRKVVDDIKGVTEGFDRVIGAGPDVGVSSERTGQRAAMGRERRQRKGADLSSRSRERKPLFFQDDENEDEADNRRRLF